MRSQQPAYAVGTKVFHVGKQRWGRVLDAWFDGKDWRYQVSHSQQDWSVPEWSLTKKKCPPFVPAKKSSCPATTSERDTT